MFAPACLVVWVVTWCFIGWSLYHAPTDIELWGVECE